MNEEERLEPLVIGDQRNDSSYTRRVDIMTRSQIHWLIRFYLTISFIIIIILMLSPSFLYSQEEELVTNAAKKGVQSYSANITNLMSINGFLSMKVYFFQNDDRKIDAIILNAMITTNTNNGDTYFFSNNFNRTIRKHNSMSDPINLYSINMVLFNSIKANITLSFYDNIPPVKFVWTCLHSAHSITAFFLRSFIFLIILDVFITLNCSNFNFKSVAITGKTLYMVDIVFIIACNPFYVISFFTHSFYIQIIDITLFNLFVTSVLFSGFILIVMNNSQGIGNSRTQFIFSILFFITMYLLNTYLCIHKILISHHPVSYQPTKFEANLPSITNFVFILFNFIIGVFVLVIYLRDTNHNDFIYIIMILIVVFTNIHSKLVNQEDQRSYYYFFNTTSFVAMSLFVFMFNYIYWPYLSSTVPDHESHEVSQEADIHLDIQSVETHVI